MIQWVEQRVRKRAFIARVGILIWFLILAGRLVELQVFQHAKLKAEAVEQNQYIRDIWPPRGTIFDSRGQILARSLPAPSLFYTQETGEPIDVKLRHLSQLQTLLHLSAREVQRIKLRIENGDRFIWIKRKISWEELEKVREAKIPGVFAQTENKRFYPLGAYLAHVLGGVNIDDQGMSGVEYKYNQFLQGKKGRVLVRRDALRRKYDLETLEPSWPGSDLILTIDGTIQYIVEKELERNVLERQANWGSVIVSHPGSGDILAMASFPDYNPNEFSSTDPSFLVNRAIQENFEPGSTFKIVVAAAALEAINIPFQRIYNCSDGRFFMGGLAIRDHKPFSLLTFPEVFIHSSNVGTIQIALEVGQEKIYEMIKRFRFGEKTGIDLPGEESGLLRPPSSWTIHTLPHLAVGYEVSVTAIQLLQAMNIIANRGVLVPPRLVKAVVGTDGPQVLPPPPGRRVLKAETAEMLTEHIFSKVVEQGTGMKAQIIGFTAAGKTGTAQKFDPMLRTYSSSKHRAIFVGFVPADKPIISMIVVIDEPKIGGYYGGDVAAPLFREIARRVLLYLGERPQLSPEQWITAQSNLKQRSEDNP